ncbi:MAG: ParB/Srx family N-terminal domain-containing protein [Phycisphaerales bacterium]|nr:ParB/Srx family N-terminal domain-containing protein [Phycisphaerales bacterium]
MTKKSKAAEAPKWPGAKVWPLGKIKEYSRNPRTHSPAQISLLAQMFLRWGPDQPIVVDESGVILKGHGRKLAAAEAGMTGFPVVQRVGLPEKEKKAIRIADNQVALLSGWDSALVQSELAELKLDDYPLDLLGFGEQQLVQFLTTPAPPDQFQQFGEDIDVEHQCPKCGYKFSGGKSAPKGE